MIKSDAPRSVISLESRGSLELELSDLIHDGRLEVYPYVENKGLLFLQFRKNKVTLSAGRYIGLIPLTPRIAVEIKPKLPVGNLARVLDTARSAVGVLADVDRRYRTEKASSVSILHFLAGNLVDAVRLLLTYGLHKEYVPISEVTGHPRGRIDTMGTIRTCWSRGHHHRVRTLRFEQTSDTPLNRVVKAALKFILTRESGETKMHSDLRVGLNAAYREFPRSIGSLRSGDLSVCQRTLERRTLPIIRAYYYRALEIALLLLSSRSISLQDQGDDVMLGTFILNFEDLFEDYLRHVLKGRCTSKFWVRDGNTDGRKALFDDQSDPPAQPDIVIMERATNRMLVVEVKYKDRPNREDINQAITYAVSYRSNRAVLLHQRRPGAAAGLRAIGVVNGIALDAYAYDLARVDLDAEERALADCIFLLALAPVHG